MGEISVLLVEIIETPSLGLAQMAETQSKQAVQCGYRQFSAGTPLQSSLHERPL